MGKHAERLVRFRKREAVVLQALSEFIGQAGELQAGKIAGFILEMVVGRNQTIGEQFLKVGNLGHPL